MAGAEENAQTQKVSHSLLTSTKQVEKIEVDMAQLELSEDSSEGDEPSSKKNSTMSRL